MFGAVSSHSQYVVPGSFAAPTRDAVRQAIRSADDLRRRVREMARETIVERRLPMEDLGGLTADAIQGAAEALSDALPANRQSALRQVLDGLADVYAGLADSTRSGLEEAHARGTRLSRAEAKRVRHALATLEQSFLDATLGSAQRLSVQARQDLAAVLSQMRGHGTVITPAAKKAMQAAERHWPELVDETVKVGTTVAKAAAGSLLLGASGLLEGLAKALKTPRATPIVARTAAERVHDRAEPRPAAKPKAKVRAGAKAPARAKATATAAKRAESKRPGATRATRASGATASRGSTRAAARPAAARGGTSKAKVSARR